MNHCAFILLSIVNACERINHPELIPSPGSVRQNPESSDALDFLLDNGHVEVLWKQLSFNSNSFQLPGSDRDRHGMEFLAITSAGIEALKDAETFLQ